MNFEDALARVKGAGWAGVAVWDVGRNNWNGCLIKPSCEPDFNTVLWNYAATAELALTQLVEKAEKQTYN